MRDTNVQGVIDFGDSVYCPIIEDIAISLAHIIGESDDFMEDICEFLKGLFIKLLEMMLAH